MSKLIKNGNVYGIRKRVPQDIVRTFAKTKTGKPKEDLWLPISKDRKEALHGIPDAEIKARDIFDAHRHEMGISRTLVVVQPVKRTPQQACEAFFAKLQADERKRRQEIVDAAKASPEFFWSGDMVPLPPVKERGLDGFHGVLAKAFAMHMAARLNDAKGALSVMDFHYIRKTTGETDESLLPLLARTEIAFLEAIVCDPGALFGPMPPLGTVRLGTPAPIKLRAYDSADDDPLFSEMADEWFKGRIGPDGKDWSAERQRIWSQARSIVIEVCTDRPISTYRVDDKAELQRVFRSLPSNRNKKLPGKSVRQQIDIAAERGMPLMDKVTANEYLRLIETCFDWIKGSKSVMHGVNPFEGAAFHVAKNGKKKVRKFEADELKAIFANPFYAKSANTDARYRTPLVGLYSGARSNSILRLKVRDVRKEDGVWFLDINDEEYSDPRIKRTDKTEAGLRRVPIHADLIELGFLRYAVARKGHEMLFPGLKPDAPCVHQRVRFVGWEPTDEPLRTLPDTVFAYDPSKIDRAGAYRINDILTDRFTAISGAVITNSVPGSVRFKVVSVVIDSETQYGAWMDHFALDRESYQALFDDVGGVVRLMDIPQLHSVIVAMASFGQRVDARWLESLDAFTADVTPIPAPIADSPVLRLYRINSALGWTKTNVAWGKPSGPLYPCDSALSKQAAERRAHLQREARRQNSYAYAYEEAA